MLASVMLFTMGGVVAAADPFNFALGREFGEIDILLLFVLRCQICDLPLSWVRTPQ